MSLKSIIQSLSQRFFSSSPKHITANITYSAPHQSLVGKRIIVTGGGHGLGAAMAEKFIREGASVLIAGRNETILQLTASRLGCSYLQLDVTDCSSFPDFIKKADEILGGVNALVNNAGVSLHEKRFFAVTPESFDTQFNTNLKGAYFLSQAFIMLVKERQQTGNVLFISSETGETADFRPYALSKAATNSLVQGLASLYYSSIRVNAVSPGITASSMSGLQEDGNLYYPYNSTKRVYLPDEVAETACFLLSDLSACISGQIITCNNAKTVNARWKQNPW